MAVTLTDRLFGENSSVAIKAPVVAVTNGTSLPLSGLTAVGSYTPSTGDRILVKDQDDATQNGIYNASTAAWTRTGDFDGANDVVQGTLIIALLDNGDGLLFQLSTQNPVIGTSALTFTVYASRAYIWPQTADEANAGVVPTSTGGSSRPWTDASERYGLVGDGATDNTVAFQAMCEVAGQSLLVKRGTYITGKFTLPEYTTLYLEPGTIIKDSGVLGADDCTMTVSNNSHIIGYGAAVDGNNSAYSSDHSEYRFGVNILGVSNVCVEGLTSQNCDGDGFYIGSSSGSYCQHITLNGCIADGNRRNGLSITAAIGCWVIGGEYMNTSGTDPQYGIDIEPNDSTTPVQNVVLLGVRTSGNAHGGIQVAPEQLSATTSNPISVTIIGHDSFGDNTSAASGQGGARITGSAPSSWANALYGQIIYRDARIFTPGCSGFRVDNWDAAHAPEVWAENITVYDAASESPAAVQDQCGAVIFGGPGLTIPTVGNIKLRNLRVFDDRGTPATYTGLYIYNSVAAIANYTIEDVECLGFTPTAGSNCDIVFLGGGSSNGVIKYSREKIVSINASHNAVNYLGKTILVTAAAVVTLPTAAQVLGQSFKVVAGAAASIQVRPQSGDTIEFWGGDSTGDVVLNWLGDVLVVRAIAANTWAVEAISDGARRPLGQSTPAHQIWNSAAPTVGTWEVGTLCWNTAPSSGNPRGWVCTTAGSPGTWTSMGNL